MGKLNTVEYQISLRDLLSNTLNKVDGNVKNFEGDIDALTDKIGNLNNVMASGNAGSFMQTTGAVALGSLLTRGIEMAGQAAVQQVKSILSAGLDAGKIRAEFSVLTGGKEMGDALFGDLNKYISDSIFGTELFGSAKTLLAYGISAQQIMPDLKMLGDIAMGDKEKMQSLTLAFGQTTAAGKLMGQDLNQYIAAGFNPLKEIERTTGKSYAVLKDAMEKGQISAQMIHQAFVSATSSGGLFFGMLDKIGETPFGKLQAMQGNIEMAKQQLGEALLPAMSDFMDASKPLIDALPAMFTALKPTIDGIIHSFTGLAEWVSKNGDTVSFLAKSVKLAIEGYMLWKAGTVALTAANWLWVQSIGAQTAATTRAAAATVSENTALVAQGEVVAALTLEYEALTASITEMSAAETLLMRQQAAMAANIPIAMGGVARGATAGGVAAGGLIGSAASAVIPVAIAYFAGEALMQLLPDNKFTGQDFSLVGKNSPMASQVNQVAFGLSIMDAFGYDMIGDAIEKVNEKNRKPIMDYQDFASGNFGSKKKETNPYFPNVKAAVGASVTTDKSTELKTDISKVTGQNVKNINVTINGGLIHDFSVNTTTLKEATPDIKRIVTQAVTDAINDSELNN